MNDLVKRIRQVVRTWLENDDDHETRAMRAQALKWIGDLEGEIKRLREDNYHGLKLLAINEWPGGGFTISWLPNRQGGYEQGHLSSDGVFWWFPSREVAEAALALAGEEAREAAEAGKDGEG
ncbi:hypothetical protein LCGC14_2052270 [marine sediment metagenome]|uniref:Uncharacterized protein n=1 Tax=marine sediment metagenome TaxID=412755 RepID=A0A0F9HKN5_9ZZZZ